MSMEDLEGEDKEFTDYDIGASARLRGEDHNFTVLYSFQAPVRGCSALTWSILYAMLSS
jgi:hypothetical protein